MILLFCIINYYQSYFLILDPIIKLFHCFFFIVFQSAEAKLDYNVKQIEQEIDLWKKVCYEGFSAVYDGLSNIDNIMEGKYKLTNQQLWKEVSQIRKMVVLM